MSTTILPVRQPRGDAVGDRTARSSTSGVSGTMMMTISDRSAIAFSVSQTVAPGLLDIGAAAVRLP